jgi:hypothetical protein
MMEYGPDGIYIARGDGGRQQSTNVARRYTAATFLVADITVMMVKLAMFYNERANNNNNNRPSPPHIALQ